MRFATILLCLAALVFGTGSPVRADDADFRAWLETVWPQAQAAGVTRATFDRALRGLEPDYALPDLDVPGRPPAAEGQPEFVQSPADYMRESTLARLAAQGRKLLAQHRQTLDAIERRFGVAPAILLAIWGRETAFGEHRLQHDALRVLATQAYVGRRKEHFLPEFVLALKMIEDGVVARSEMRSSWAGAMGLTQFLPSDFYRHGVDFDGDGHVDIWRSVPDALASAARQLIDKGWQPGRRWGYEVRAPADLDCTLADPDRPMPIAAWLARGFSLMHGRSIGPAERREPASLLLPEGTYGPAFLAPANYFVLKAYNYADLYVLFVGQLSDHIADPQTPATRWGKAPLLRTREIEELQQALSARGYYSDKIDGKAGMKTRLALGLYQKANGLKVDCWPTAAALAHLRGLGAGEAGATKKGQTQRPGP
ncbi:MAG: lytic murein transglycosylase [Variibacter sp.]|nr:lytic murein transglycosylase [Variibacter sp.]